MSCPEGSSVGKGLRQVGLKSWVSLLGLILLLALLHKLQNVLMLTLLACLLAAALSPAVSWLSARLRFPRPAGIVVLYGVLLALGAGVLYLLFNVFSQEAAQFMERFPHYVETTLDPFLSRHSISQFSGEVDWLQKGLTFLQHYALSALAKLRLVVEALVASLTILAFAFYLLSNPAYFENCILALLPAREHARVRRVLSACALKAGAYVRSQLWVMSGTGLLVWLGLTLLHLPYAFVLGILAFFLDFVPVLGPIIATTIGAVVALGHHPSLLPGVLCIYLVARLAGDYLLSPMFVGRSLELHPFWILFSILAGGSLMGVVGVFLAVPLATTLQILVEEYYIRGYLQTSNSDVGANV